MPEINKRILMSDAHNFSNDQPINPYYHQEYIDRNVAASEHDAVKSMLVNAGVEVISVASPANCQDGVYTANWALVRGDKAVLARLPNARCAEENYAREVLTGLGKQIIDLPEGLKFSGQGDALACGDLLFCGSGYRSDEEAQRIAADSLGYERIQLKTIPKTDENGRAYINPSTGWPDSYFYDLDLALAIIRGPSKDRKGLIAYCPDAFMPDSRALLSSLGLVDKIEVSIDEAKNAFATNLVSTGETVVMSAHAPILSDDLRRYGLIVVSPEISELAKGGGYIRCVTLTID